MSALGQTCLHGHLARQCEVCDLTAEVARLTAVLDPIRTLFAPIPDEHLVASIGRAWCARANEEGLRQERDDALADWKQAEANGAAFADERDEWRTGCRDAITDREKAEAERDKWKASYDALLRRVIRADTPEVGHE